MTKTIPIDPTNLTPETAEALSKFFAQQQSHINAWHTRPIKPYSFLEKGKKNYIQLRFPMERRWTDVIGIDEKIKKSSRYDAKEPTSIGAGSYTSGDEWLGVRQIICTLTPFKKGFLSKDNKNRLAKTIAYDDPEEQLLANREAEFSRRLPHLHSKKLIIEDTSLLLGSAIKNKITVNKVAHLVMRAMEGNTLRNVLKNIDQITSEQRFKISINLLRALKKIHAAGLIHADIKPANIIVNMNTCEVAIIDMGISGEAGEALSERGTLVYKAPECRQNVTQCSDIFSMGITLGEIWDNNPYARLGTIPIKKDGLLEKSNV